MQKFYLTVVFTMLLSVCYPQPDTIVKKQQKGFLFLSAFNGRYDGYVGHMRPVGFHDFFYPAKDFSINSFSIDTVFSDGIRVDYLMARFGLKKNALKIYGKDTSNCYHYDNIYVIPVIIDFKESEDHWPFACQRNFYEFTSKHGANTRFEYKHRSAVITKLTELPVKK